MNQVDYWRVECEDVAAFTARVATDMYGCPSDQVLNLIHKGFSWPSQ
jgi:hypothetical protein